MIFTIDSEFESLIPPLGEDAFAQLRDNILSAGRILDPVRVWRQAEGCNVIIDGHNRYRIYSENIAVLPEPAVEYIELADREAVKSWMRENQRGRRNLSPDQQLILDLQAGVTSAGAAIKQSQAKLLLSDCPSGAALVISGKKSLGQAYNDWRRALKTAPNPISPTKRSDKKTPKGRIHLVIGDTQTKPGVPTEHLRWIGQYIVDQFSGADLAIVHLGDHWDMPSLSTYDVGKKEIEGRRYSADVEAGNAALRVLNEPIAKEMERIKWKPERHMLMGNHENRIQRACNDAAHLDGKLSLGDLDLCGWTRHDFLRELVLDGISYSHYFYHPNTGRPYSGENLYPRLKTIGRSFTMGHQQGLQYALRPVGEARHQGLVLGSCYLHEEKYLGPQGTAYWRGIVVKHQVENGTYDPMFVSLEYLCRRYEKTTLTEFLKGRKAEAA